MIDKQETINRNGLKAINANALILLTFIDNEELHYSTVMHE